MVGTASDKPYIKAAHGRYTDYLGMSLNAGELREVRVEVDGISPAFATRKRRDMSACSREM